LDDPLQNFNYLCWSDIQDGHHCLKNLTFGPIGQIF
jgi:hypothetical protein